MELQADSLNQLVITLYQAGKYNEAIPFAEEVLQKYIKVHGLEHPTIVTSYGNLAVFYRDQGRYTEAESLFGKALKLSNKLYGEVHSEIATNLNNLAVLYHIIGRYKEADSRYLQALEINKKIHGDEHPDIAANLNNIAFLYHTLGNYSKAELKLQQALRIRRKLQGEEHIDVAVALNNLAEIYHIQGNYGKAEPLYQQALKILNKIYEEEHYYVAIVINNLAELFHDRGDDDNAEELYLKALQIDINVHGEKHYYVATSRSNLANFYRDHKRLEEAENLAQKAYKDLSEVYGETHPDVVSSLGILAMIHLGKGRLEKAEQLLKQVVETNKAMFGEVHPDVIIGLRNLAAYYFDQQDYQTGATYIESAISISKETTVNPELLSSIYYWNARLQKQLSKPTLAMEDLAHSLEIAEQMRPQIGGGEETRATFFQQYDARLDLMVNWQLEAGNTLKTFEYLERSRARTLLDQLAAGKINLWNGIEDPEQRNALLNKENNAQVRKTEYQQRIILLRSRKDLSDEEKRVQIDTLNAQLRQAEKDFQDVYNEIKNASWLWRDVITSGGKPVTLATVQRRLLSSGSCMLSYQIGEEESHLFLISTVEQSLTYLPLSVKADVAKVFGFEAGTLTNEKLNQILIQADSTFGQRSILQILGKTNRGGINPINNPRSDSLMLKLSALREILIPDPLWPKLKNLEEVIIIPDGALNLLPFETLVIDPGENPAKTRYWLDEGPPIRYAASATVLYNITQRPAARLLPDVNQPKVLSLSDPVFDFSLVQQVVSGNAEGERTSSAETDDAQKSDAIERLDALLANVTRNEYERIGGPLKALPGTAWESDALQSVYATEGDYPELKVLQQMNATEAQLRQHLPGKRYIHIGTHGLVDQQRNSAFASLALTPSGADTINPANDGFLELHEIYGLKLPDCELAVLSACETNVGRYVEGEGVFALTRGFLAAGARRVIASQWPVNDASSAEIIGAFFQTVAGDEKAGKPVNYSKALHEAKRKVRQQEKWAAPFYWAPFVITGKR